MNYVIVTFMLLIIGIAGHLALSAFGVAPAVAPEQPSEKATPSTTPVNLREDGTFQAISVGQ
jgi:hypothetical protein